ncbi:hypothetical protein ANCDUO_14058 [Ancylostoma duodenale]|uniref:Cadherin domain-containing protein n=1 Tax=Ancylostoma duodenale TaxID=51022 RepID=A0A0C2D168_9BILA|nr:hypothetical protein ANCDUO_14058 [Ancylostoma duodenale]
MKVKATNSLCGGSSRLRYAFQDNANTAKLFNIDSTSGTICLENKLDFEKEISHQLTVSAIDQTLLGKAKGHRPKQMVASRGTVW